MPPQEYLEVRPRTTGEILDDGWRLYRGDLPLLLALSGLFLLPAAGVALWLPFQPGPDGPARLLLPALAAGQKHLWRAWRHSLRASGRHPARALVVVAARAALLGFAAVNLHLFARFFLWVAE